MVKVKNSSWAKVIVIQPHALGYKLTTPRGQQELVKTSTICKVQSMFVEVAGRLLSLLTYHNALNFASGVGEGGAGGERDEQFEIHIV